MRHIVKWKDNMRCSYCEKAVLGSGPITVPGVGPAHEVCYQTSLIRHRIFAGLNIAELDDLLLNELSDMVLMEKNARSSETSGSEDDFEIELF